MHQTFSCSFFRGGTFGIFPRQQTNKELVRMVSFVSTGAFSNLLLWETVSSRETSVFWSSLARDWQIGGFGEKEAEKREYCVCMQQERKSEMGAC